MNEEEMHDVNGGWSVDIGWKKVFWNVKRPVLNSITLTYDDALKISIAGVAAIVAIVSALYTIAVAGQIVGTVLLKAAAKVLAGCIGFVSTIVGTNDSFNNWRKRTFTYNF